MSEKENVRKVIFNMFDIDKSGYIDNSELKKAFEQLCQEKIPQSAIDEILKEYDSDNNGKLSFDEFCKLADKLDELEN